MAFDFSARGFVPREQKMLQGHLPRVMYQPVYESTKVRGPYLLGAERRQKPIDPHYSCVPSVRRCGSRFTTRGLRFGVWGLKFRLLRFSGQGLGLALSDLGFGIWGLGFGVQCSGFRF